MVIFEKIISKINGHLIIFRSLPILAWIMSITSSSTSIYSFVSYSPNPPWIRPLVGHRFVIFSHKDLNLKGTYFFLYLFKKLHGWLLLPLLPPQYIVLRPMVQTLPRSAPESLSISSLIFLFVQVILLNGNCAGLGAAAVIFIQNHP